MEEIIERLITRCPIRTKYGELFLEKETEDSPNIFTEGTRVVVIKEELFELLKLSLIDSGRQKGILEGIEIASKLLNK